MRESVEILRSTLSPDSLTVAFAECMLGEALVGQGRFDEAEPLLVAGYQRIAASVERPGFATLDTLNRVVALYDSWGRLDEAARYRADLSRAVTSSRHLMPCRAGRNIAGTFEPSLAGPTDQWSRGAR